MGEVYRARDSRLQRTVAIKVLSGPLARDGEFRERFEREARVVSSFSHPHIGALYDIGRQGDLDYLVLEFLEGETLAERLERGALRPQEAVRIGVEVAEALDQAHRQGLIHRDIKPANIMLTRTGAKLMDFGLAKPGMGSSFTNNLAVTSNRPLTTQGMVVGTLPYMSPEQAQGLDVNYETDIFSFGAVLYEMLVGQRAFRGTNQASLVAAVLERDPEPIRVSHPELSPALERVVKKCLEKDPEKRWRSAADLADELRWILEADPQVALQGEASKWDRKRFAWVAVGLALLAAVLGMTLLGQKRETAPVYGTIRFSLLPPNGGGFVAAGNESVAISPDGQSLAFSAYDTDGKQYLWMRSLHALTARRLAGSEGGTFPFWSPDSRFVGFFAQGKLKKAPVDSGTTQDLCNVGNGAMGGSWSAAGVILIGSDGTSGDIGRPISRCSDSSGGEMTAVTALDNDRKELSQRWPVFLPDGKHFLYLSFNSDPMKRVVYVGSLGSSDKRVVMNSPFKVAYGDGDLFFVRDGSLLAQNFDLGSWKLKGDPIIVAEHVSATVVPGVAGFSVSGNGALAYLNASEPAITQLTWMSRAGTKLEEVGTTTSDVGVSLTANQRLALVGRVVAGTENPISGEAPTNIWSVDLSRATTSRLTFGDTNRDENPIPSPDGSEFVFASHRGGEAEVYRKATNGEGNEKKVPLTDSRNAHPIDWSSNGRYLLFHVFAEAGRIGLATLDLNGPTTLSPFSDSNFSHAQGQFSPDGRFIAYLSDESGRQEIYVQPFPATGGKWQVSLEGGSEPRWRSDGKELFFVSPDGVLMAAPVQLSPSFEAGKPAPLFRLETHPSNIHFYGGMANYEPSRDGQKFLVNRIVKGGRIDPVNIVLHWSGDAKR